MLKAWPLKPGGGDGLLLLVEPVAVGVLRADDDCAGGSDGGDAVASDGAVDAEHVDIVAEGCHEVVVGVVAAGLRPRCAAHGGSSGWRSSERWQPKQEVVHEEWQL